MSTSRCLILVSSVDTQRIQNVRMIGVDMHVRK